MNKTQKQRGFAIVESLLVLVVVAIIGGTGYFVWHSKQQTDKSLSAASTENQVTNSKKTSNSSPPVTDETANWLVYKSPENIYRLKIPDGWSLVRETDASFTLVGFSLDDITYKSGAKATVETQPGGRGGPVPFMLGVVGREGYTIAKPSGDKQSSFKTNQGVDVDKYVFTQTSEPDGPDLPVGGKSYGYVISKGSTTIEINHDEVPGDPNNVNTLEKMIKTLEL
jgi:type II secretory pathway pseudopilin PulG